ncbi:MAG: hypothetical protein H6686_11465 [Fibrobacteria bacterium]|nr:hypothetical protein [Fibrobacteria bacterium]
MNRATTIAAALSLCLASAPFAQDCQEGVDWVARTVCAKGIGAVNPKQPQAAARPGAIRSAQMTGLRAAVELVKGVQVNSNTTIANSMTESDVVKSKVEAYVKGFQFSQPHYMDDLTVEVYVQMPLDGISDLVLPSSIQSVPTVTSWGAPTEVSGPAAAGTASPAPLRSQVYTGLVVDARGLGVLPALAPRITDIEGKEIYGGAVVSRDWAVKNGMVGYAKSIDGARGLKDRIGASPAVVKAVRADGASKTDLVLSAEDAASLRSAAENLTFLSQARVVFVVD